MCTGVKFRPKSFVRRFRVTVRKFLYYQKRISKLGPTYYNCNSQQSDCTRRGAKPRQGCPDCEFTIQTRQFENELEGVLRKLKLGTRKGNRKWPAKRMLETVMEVGHISSLSKEMNPNWTVPVSTLVSIYRDETAKMRLIDTYVPETK